MPGIDPADLLTCVIRPTLDAIGLGGRAAEELLLGTAAQETGLGRRLKQVHGPGLGPYQIEPATHEDIAVNFLHYHVDLRRRVLAFAFAALPLVEQLKGNLCYATAIARVIYLRVPAELPPAGDPLAQAEFYKAHYNTAGGAATTDEYVDNYHALIGDIA